MMETSMEKNFKQDKLDTMPVFSLLISMALPPMISMFTQYTYNMVDCMFVSWISEKALSAVSLAFPITTLVISLSIGVGVGTNVLIAKALGEKRQETANSIVSHSLILSTVFSIFITAMVLLIIKPFYGAFSNDGEIYALGLDYTYIVAFMATGNMVHIAIQKIIQATGNMIAPMVFQLAGAALNFILDPILIFGWGSIPAMGVKGAAAATVAGFLFSMILAFYVLVFTKQKVKIQTKGFRLDGRIFIKIFRVGLPSLAMNALGAFMTVFANLFLVTYSMTAVAFFGAYFKIQQLIVMTVNGLIQGCLPAMSYHYGAKNRERLQQIFKVGTMIAVVMMGLGTVIVMCMPRLLLGIFKASEDMMNFGVPAMRIMGISYVFAAIGIMFASYFQATGRIVYSLWINLLRQLVLLVPFMWVFSSWKGIDGIWWAFPAAEILTAAICWIWYLKYPLIVRE